ncbi:MAG: TldD/PmbA family protein [Candidatus Hecatellales archaeon]|nr:MAG: TldD/PmbA family protein [Candidatus Hecatellales archaeon]
MEEALLEALDVGMKLGASLVEARGEKTVKTRITVKDGRIEVAREGFESGIGVRVLAKGAWGYASTSNVDSTSAGRAAEEAFKLASSIGEEIRSPVRLAEVKPERVKLRWGVKVHPSKVPIEEKASLTLGLNRSLLEADGRIRSCTVEYLDLSSLQYVYTSEGARVLQEKVYVWLRVTLSAYEAGVYATASEEAGASLGFEYFEEARIEALKRRLVDRVKGQLEAVAAKGGAYPAVLGPSVVGVFAHESLGHMAEADLALSGSILLDQAGRQVASNHVTIYDDGGLEGSFGYSPYDDEGVRARRVAILEQGRVTGFLHNRETAGRLEAEPTGNARAENFRYTPIVRMRNTFMAPGDHSLEELFEPVRFGYYLKALRGGQTNMDGTFQVGVQEAYEIVKGEVGRPVRNLSIAGNTLETLMEVEAVGRDFELWPGRCGKGQTAFISDGGPTIRVRSLRIGGRD